MARTAGSTSLVAIPFKTLCDLLGENFGGKIVLSRVWLDAIERPFPLVMVREDETDQLPIERSEATQPQRRPRMVVQD